MSRELRRRLTQLWINHQSSMLAAVRLQSLCRTFATANQARQLLPLLPRVSAAFHTSPQLRKIGFSSASSRNGSLLAHSRTMASAVSGAGGKQ